MIPPIAVTPTTLGYTADALRARIGDLGAVSDHLARATMALAADPTTRAGVLRAELAGIDASVRRLRDDLTAVLAAIDPAEATRRDGFAATLSSIGGLVTALPVTLGRVINGTAWAPLRLASATVESVAPWSEPPPAVSAVTRVDESVVTSAPRTMAERVNRIPRGDDRVRIDRYVDEAGERFEVYIGGTDFAAVSDDPWWAGSNLDMLGTGTSRSVEAVAESMRLSGITSSTPVVLTGHSQGGAIALALARSGSWTVDAVFTVGTPVGLVGDDPGTPTVHVEHVNDVVPAAGGTLDETSGTTWLAIPSRRQWGIDSHLWSTYRDTAARIDAMEPPDLTALERRIERHGAGTATVFRVASSW